MLSRPGRDLLSSFDIYMLAYFCVLVKRQEVRLGRPITARTPAVIHHCFVRK